MKNISDKVAQFLDSGNPSYLDVATRFKLSKSEALKLVVQLRSKRDESIPELENKQKEVVIGANQDAPQSNRNSPRIGRKPIPSINSLLGTYNASHEARFECRATAPGDFAMMRGICREFDPHAVLKHMDTFFRTTPKDMPMQPLKNYWKYLRRIQAETLV